MESYTHGGSYTILVSKRFLSPGDRVLLLDDFLARGSAMLGLMDLVAQSGAALVGCGVAIEKGFQEGGRLLRERGVRVESLAIIQQMDQGRITFA